MSMIKKSLFVFLLLIISYLLFIQHIANPDKYTSEHQWQDNQILAQNFLYSSTDSIQNVILGSSISFRLKTELLPKTKNLGYGGLGIFDGFKTLEAKNFYPKVLFIEMNFIDREANIEFISSIENPLMNMLRKYFPAFRDGKQPMSFIAFPYGQKLSLYTLYILQSAIYEIHPDNPNINDSENKDLMESEILPQQILYYTNNINNIEKSITKLKEYISIYEKNGTKIVFFEMPVQYQLADLPRSTMIRSFFYKTFPKDQYLYFDCPDMKEYKTTDGIHLDGFYSEKYTKYFLDMMIKKHLD